MGFSTHATLGVCGLSWIRISAEMGFTVGRVAFFAFAHIQVSPVAYAIQPAEVAVEAPE
jgi:hypothetical protein